MTQIRGRPVTWTSGAEHFVSDPAVRVACVMDGGGVRVSVGEVLDVLGGCVLLVPESTLDALTCEAREAFAAAAESATASIVFVVPDEVLTDF